MTTNAEKIKVSGTLSISADVECPSCEEYIDLLLDLEGLTDDGYLYNKLMPDDDCWGNDSLNEAIECPHCGTEFVVEKIIY